MDDAAGLPLIVFVPDAAPGLPVLWAESPPALLRSEASPLIPAVTSLDGLVGEHRQQSLAAQKVAHGAR